MSRRKTLIGIRHISQRKIIRFRWNFVHSSRFWTGWTSRDQKLKSCIGQTPSLTERISCFFCSHCLYRLNEAINHKHASRHHENTSACDYSVLKRYFALNMCRHNVKQQCINRGATWCTTSYTVSQKTCSSIHRHNFSKCWLIVKILSLLDSARVLSHCPPYLKHVPTLPCEIQNIKNMTHNNSLLIMLTKWEN